MFSRIMLFVVATAFAIPNMSQYMAQDKDHRGVVLLETKGRLAHVSLLHINRANELLHAVDGPRLLAWSLSTKEKVFDFHWNSRGIPFTGPKTRTGSGDDRLMAMGAWEGFSVWNTESDKWQFQRMPGPVTSVAFTGDNKLLTAIGPLVALWDLETMRRVRYFDSGNNSLTKRTGNVFSLSCSAKSGAIVAGHDDGSLSILDQRLLLKKSLHAHDDGAVTHAILVEEDTKVLSAGTDGMVVLTSLADEKRTKVFEDEYPISCMAYCAAKSRVILGTDGGLFAVVDLSSGKTVIRDKLPQPVLSVALSEDGSIGAVSCGSTADNAVTRSKNAILRCIRIEAR